MSEQEQQLLAVQQNLEQLGEFLRTAVAPLVASYYRALVSHEVGEASASALAAGLQDEFFAVFFRGEKFGERRM